MDRVKLLTKVFQCYSIAVLMEGSIILTAAIYRIMGLLLVQMTESNETHTFALHSARDDSSSSRDTCGYSPESC